jgi:hypothetical protein
MDAERWRRVESLFHQALEHEEPARRLFLDEQCADDLELRGEVDRWLVVRAEPLFDALLEKMDLPRN